MSTATATQAEVEVKGELAVSANESYVSWEVFEKDYLTREDEFRYEWLDGTIEKTHRPMNRTQILIQTNIKDAFVALRLAKKVNGRLVAEGDLFFKNHHRRPDLCWLTGKQINSLHKGNKDVPAFTIEIISKRDSMNQMARKMNDYRRADVQTVWHIFPKLKEVHVYYGKNLSKMEVFRDEETFSAAPVLAEFKLKVSELFQEIEE